MNKEKSIEIFKQCIDMIKSLSKEQFDEILKVKGIYDKVYEGSYVDERFEIILPYELVKMPTVYNTFNIPGTFFGTRFKVAYELDTSTQICNDSVQAIEECIDDAA